MDGLSFTGKRWHVRDDIRASLGMGGGAALHIAEHLLRLRGVGGAGADLQTCGYPSSAFPQMPQAVDRIRAAAASGERVAVFGDYDCDGITSAALLARWFARRGRTAILRLPHREREGYGLRMPAVRELAAAGTRLLITVDTGISCAPEIAEARALGMDVIIADHHTVPALVPETTATLHPALSPGFPEPHPSAAGVVWSLVRALELADGVIDWEDSDTDLALAAIGTVADLVPLRGGNRTLAQAGTAAINRITKGPLALLKIQSGMLDAPLTSRDIAFRIAPRLNAAGRMAEPDIALRAVLGDEQSVLRLEELNRGRQALVAELMTEAERETDVAAPFLCLAGPRYLAGVCGLIAGKLTERHGRPSLVAHDQGERCVASLRSIAAYDVAAGLARNAHLLSTHGGHAMAAGCSFPSRNLPALREALCADVLARVPMADLVTTVQADMVLDAAHFTRDLHAALQRLEPYGQGNMEPLFLLENIVMGSPRTVGRDQSHLQAHIGRTKSVAFGLGKLLGRLTAPVDVLCRIGIDTWQGRNDAQLFVEDIRARVAMPAKVQ